MVCQWPNEQECGRIATSWYKYKLPLCVGAIDGTLVATKCYQPNRQELNTRKSHFAFNVLLVCDFKGCIRHYVCDAPGSMADVTIYEESDLFSGIVQRLKNDNNTSHPFYLISDKGIPNLM